jgi:hypothetical protein
MTLEMTTTFYEHCDDIIPEGCEYDWIMTNIAYVSYDYQKNNAAPESEVGDQVWRRVVRGFIKILEPLHSWAERAPVVDALFKYLCNLQDRPSELTELLIRKLSMLADSATPMCQALYEQLTVQPELAESISRASSPLTV